MRKKIVVLIVIAAVIASLITFFLVDLDGDGLSNFTELRLGTSINNSDTDGDGLNDGLEVNSFKTNPFATDTDYDNLDDVLEIENYGTDPLAIDTDDDGLSDSLEINIHGTNPLGTDTDNDDLNDWTEISVHGSNPKSTDTDNDGLSDGLEVNTHATDLLDSDTDNDGLLDAVEVNGWSITINGASSPVTSSPFSSDSDEDNLSDWAEYNTYSSNPMNINTDGDSLSDLLEVLYNTDLSDESSTTQQIENAPTYPHLFLEIDYMSGHAPTPEAISYIETYFEYDLAVRVEVVQEKVTDSELSSISVSPSSISIQELVLIESQFHDNPTTHLYVFYANELESVEESGGVAGEPYGTALNGVYLPSRLDRERTILLHEIGHALGLQHTDDPASAMQSGPIFLEPIYASSWSERNLLDVISIDEPYL